MARARRKPRLAVWKFASCDGCQLSLLDCEDELLLLADRLDIAYFVEAKRSRINAFGIEYEGRTGLSTAEFSWAA